MEQRVHVLHGGAAVGEAGAAEEALEEAEHEEAGEVVDQGGGDGEDDEEGEGGDVDGVAADDGDLAEGSEEERTNAIWEVELDLRMCFREERGELTGQDI